MKDKKKKIPAFQFYPGDWRKDPGVQSLDFFDRGVWVELLCLMHESPKRGYLVRPDGTAMDDEAIARLVGLPLVKLKKCLSRLDAAGVPSRCPESGALMNRRMARDEQIRQIRSDCGTLGAEFGNLGGRPKTAKITASETANITAKEGQSKRQRQGQKNPPSSSSSDKKEESKDSSSATSRAGGDPAWDLYGAKYQERYGTPYRPEGNQRTGCAVQLAKLRKDLNIGTRDNPPDWPAACDNYLRTPQKTHTLADLCVNYATFRKAPLDRFERPVDEKPEPSVHDFL